MTHPQVAVDALDTMFAENDGFIIVGPEYRRETIGIHNIIAPLLTADLRKELDAANAKLAHIGHCAICRRVIDMRETDDGGDGFGAENEDGTWSCSSGCQSEYYLNAANAKLEVVAAALKPFSAEASRYDEGSWPEKTWAHGLTLTDLRQARAALAEMERPNDRR